MEKERQEELEKKIMQEDRVTVYDEEEELFAIKGFANMGYPDSDALIMVYSIFRNEKKKLRCKCGSKEFLDVTSTRVGEYGESLHEPQKVFRCFGCGEVIKSQKE